MPPLPEPQIVLPEPQVTGEVTARIEVVWIPDEKKLERLRQLCENPKIFHRPMKPAETTEAMKVRELTRLMLQTNTKKMLRQTKSQCLQFGIPFAGVEDRPEDLDRLVIFVTDGAFRAKVRQLATEWEEDEKKVLREAFRVALKRHVAAVKPGEASEAALCLSCSTNPATSSDDTVPLCEACKALTGDSRGVQFAADE